MSGFEVVAGLAVAAAALSAYSTIQAGQQAKQAQQFNATVADNNAKQALSASASQQTDAQYKAMQLLGTEKAAAGAAGVDPNQGSPLDIMSNTASRTTLDALRIKYAGQTQDINYLNQAALDRTLGSNAETNSYSQAGATLLNGASRAYGAVYGGPGAGGGGATTLQQYQGVTG